MKTIGTLLKTIGTWLAYIILAVVVLGVFCLCGKFAEEDRAKYQTDDTHSVKSGVVPYMANPVHKWHPANVNHVNHR